MSAQIIPFPKKVKREPKYTVDGVEVIPPTNGWEYLDLCKRFLTEEDYFDISVAIIDPAYYKELDEDCQKIVDCFNELEMLANGKF